ncbi:hypothetical protein Tco_0344971 [Tanacetum coccineum]
MVSYVTSTDPSPEQATLFRVSECRRHKMFFSDVQLSTLDIDPLSILRAIASLTRQLKQSPFKTVSLQDATSTSVQTTEKSLTLLARWSIDGVSGCLHLSGFGSLSDAADE